MALSNAPRKLDRAGDPRYAHFDYFCSLAYPYAGMTVDVDIQALMDFCGRSGAPFFLTLLYCVSRAANAVPELRRRIIDGEIWEYPWCPSSHTVAKADGSYAYCTLRADKPLRDFLPEAARAHEACKRNGSIQEDADSLSHLFLSSLPWMRYTALVQPVPCPADSNPRITWGRRFEENGRTRIPMSLLCHHALADGLHIARFYEALDAELERLGA